MCARHIPGAEGAVTTPAKTEHEARTPAPADAGWGSATKACSDGRGTGHAFQEGSVLTAHMALRCLDAEDRSDPNSPAELSGPGRRQGRPDSCVRPPR